MKKIIESLEEKANFNLNDDENKKFEKDLSFFLNEIKIFDNFDLNLVEPSFRPYEVGSKYLREDVEEEVSSDELNLDKNSRNFIDDYFVLEEK